MGVVSDTETAGSRPVDVRVRADGRPVADAVRARLDAGDTA